MCQLIQSICRQSDGEFLRKVRLRPYYRWGTLCIVGLFGFLVSLWISRAILEIEADRLEQRFKLAARGRAQAVVAELRQPLTHLETLQRLFMSVEGIDGDAFRQFAGPMLAQHGVLSYNWFPKVSAAKWPQYERSGRKFWGTRFPPSTAFPSPAPLPPEARFPLLYAVPEATGYWMLGTDLYQTPSLAYLIDQAIDNGAASASDAGVFLGGTPQPGVLLLLVPTYRAERVPSTRIARRESATGVVLAVVDIGMLFAEANRNLPEAGFHVSLLDRRREPMKQQIFAWESRTGADKLPGDGVLQYVEKFEIARHLWMLKVEAATGWIRANHSGGQPFILPFGLLASGLLVIYLNNLLKRSVLAERLAGMHADSIEEQRKVQSWVDKLSMAVEQNPATIYITGLDGRIEYVNDKFVETTGYSREEAVGENPFVLSHGAVGDAIYREMQETLASGLTWYGELQNTRRDGTRYWERAMIAPIKDRDGATTNFVAIKENISELRDVLIRLQETESRFRAAMSVMVEGLAIVGEDGVFLFGNRAAEICHGSLKRS